MNEKDMNMKGQKVLVWACIKIKNGEWGSQWHLLTPAEASWWEKTTDTRLLNILQCLWESSGDELSYPMLTLSLLRNTATKLLRGLSQRSLSLQGIKALWSPSPPLYLICSPDSGKNHCCLSLLHAYFHHSMDHPSSTVICLNITLI